MITTLRFRDLDKSKVELPFMLDVEDKYIKDDDGYVWAIASIDPLPLQVGLHKSVTFTTQGKTFTAFNLQIERYDNERSYIVYELRTKEIQGL